MKKPIIQDIWKVNDLDVYYTNDTNGGGSYIGQEYFNLIQTRYPNRKFSNCLEWCSGPGFIGLGLLSMGLCNHASFNELYQPAIDMLELTKKHNSKYAESISVYPGENLSKVPNDVKFDLVVGNPPHFFNSQIASISLGYDKMGFDIEGHLKEILVDENWTAHRNFYKYIKKMLSPNGIILIQENGSGSSNMSKDFEDIIHEAGLKITDEFLSEQFFDPNAGMLIYYLEVRHA